MKGVVMGMGNSFLGKKFYFALLTFSFSLAFILTACSDGEVQTIIKEVPVEKIVVQEKIKTVEVPVETEKVVIQEKIKEVVSEKIVVAEPDTSGVVTTEPTGSGSITIALGGIAPLIQDQRRDISAVGGIGKDFSVYETLVRAPHNSPPAPPPQDHTGYSPDDGGIASFWEINEDFTAITFTIRNNIPWHSNGGNWGYVDANDVAWSYNQAFALDSVNNGAEEIGSEMKSGFSVSGPMEVIQHIEAGGFDPTWSWLQGNASFSGIVITNQDAYSELGPEGFAEVAIGTGRYMATEWKGEDKVSLQAVKNHWSGTDATVGNVEIVAMPEEATRDAALRAGEVHIAELSPQIIAGTVEAIGGSIQEIGIARPQGFQMAGNYWSTDCPGCEGGVMPRPGYDEALEKGFPWVGDLSDAASMENARKVRWAMAMAINKESIIENILEGNGRVIHAWQNILPSDPSHKDEWVIPYDPDKAREYMAEAGYADGFDYEIWIPANFAPGTVAAAQAVVEMWRQELKMQGTIDATEYGIRRPQTVDKTINVPFTHGINWIPGATSARYICAAGGHIVVFTMEQKYCDIGLSNATETSLQKRIANNIEVQDYLSEQMLFVPMFQASANLFVVSPDIASWSPYNSQDVLPNRPESITLK
ncbi:MAG: hypothetical protein CL780_03970 [Chloroflexi bacterium]|nr:hypothetical protein [Chloroflexota bacterium]